MGDQVVWDLGGHGWGSCGLRVETPGRDAGAWWSRLASTGTSRAESRCAGYEVTTEPRPLGAVAPRNPQPQSHREKSTHTSKPQQWCVLQNPRPAGLQNAKSSPALRRV